MTNIIDGATEAWRLVCQFYFFEPLELLGCSFQLEYCIVPFACPLGDGLRVCGVFVLSWHIAKQHPGKLYISAACSKILGYTTDVPTYRYQILDWRRTVFLSHHQTIQRRLSMYAPRSSRVVVQGSVLQCLQCRCPNDTPRPILIRQCTRFQGESD